MNKKIQELSEQAKAESSRWLGSKPAITITYDELEKFAQLIVQECAEVSKNYAGGSMPLSIALAIKEHFGVKE